MRLGVDYDSSSSPLMYFFPSIQFCVLQTKRMCLGKKDFSAHHRLQPAFSMPEFVESDVIVFKLYVFTVTCTMKRTTPLRVLRPLI